MSNDARPSPASSNTFVGFVGYKVYNDVLITK
jgi:hypothetical protein